jgi:hypothetical protein
VRHDARDAILIGSVMIAYGVAVWLGSRIGVRKLAQRFRAEAILGPELVALRRALLRRQEGI